MTAGIRLAHFGKKVCICEKHDRLGGLNSYYTMGSYKMETGLHAMTNFSPKKASKSNTMLKLLRQLRIPYESLELREQNHSLVHFPETVLKFSNDFSFFENSVAENFPHEIDNLREMDKMLLSFDELSLSNQYMSSKKIVDEYLKDPLLQNMLMCPMMYYGNARPDDMDFSMFAVLYKSIFHEGLSRPAGAGIRLILKLLKDRFLESGGELKLNSGIVRINTENGNATSVETTKGETLSTKKVLSDAGYFETMALCDNKPTGIENMPVGEIAFAESIAELGGCLDHFDNKETIIFFNDSDSFTYRKPDSLIDTKSGTICFPTNFQFKPDDEKPSPAIRTTVMANCDKWRELSKDEYTEAKKQAATQILKKTEAITGVANIEENAELVDTVTPLTFERFTGHANGSIYGAPDKCRDGKTHLDNLYLCGTDQGFLGIIGAMFSGVTIANLYLLK